MITDEKVFYMIFAISCLAGILYCYQKYRKKGRREGFEEESKTPMNIEESLKRLKDGNTMMLDNLLITKNRAQYEEYLIELYNHIQISSLRECLKPTKSVKQRIENLHKIDSHYKPMKEMLNDTMKYLDSVK